MSFACLSCGGSLLLEYRNCPGCGDAISDFVREHRERPVGGNYRLIRKLGGGGMGEVYKAHHIYLQTDCVIKVMRPALAGNASLGERFLREARVARKIQHPNVATLHEFSGLPDGSFYMVWEFIDGRNAGQRIRERGALPAREVIALSVQALSGLEAIHRAGFVHRDISPDNIMITRDKDGADLVKIIDLGIAKEGTETGETQTATGMFIGKAKYASPEQLGMLMPGERLDPRSDVYSFGIVMYEMLAGQAPFTASSPHEYVVLHGKQPPPALPQLVLSDGLGPALQRVIFKALEKDRTNRFASAAAMGRALSALTESPEAQSADTEVVPRRVTMEAPRFLTRAETAPRRARFVVPVAASALVLLLIVAGVIAGRNGDNAPPDDVAATTSQTSSVDSTSVTPSGTTMAEKPQPPADTQPAPDRPTPSEPIRMNSDVKAPVLLSRVNPKYPEVARKARITGAVIVETIVTKNGDVTSVRVLKPLPFGLDQAAVDAVRQWKFRPATLYGEPVDVYFNLTVNFRIEGSE